MRSIFLLGHSFVLHASVFSESPSQDPSRCSFINLVLVNVRVPPPQATEHAGSSHAPQTQSTDLKNLQFYEICVNIVNYIALVLIHLENMISVHTSTRSWFPVVNVFIRLCIFVRIVISTQTICRVAIKCDWRKCFVAPSKIWATKTFRIQRWTF